MISLRDDLLDKVLKPLQGKPQADVCRVAAALQAIVGECKRKIEGKS